LSRTSGVTNERNGEGRKIGETTLANFRLNEEGKPKVEKNWDEAPDGEKAAKMRGGIWLGGGKKKDGGKVEHSPWQVGRTSLEVGGRAKFGRY